MVGTIICKNDKGNFATLFVEGTFLGQVNLNLTFQNWFVAVVVFVTPRKCDGCFKTVDPQCPSFRLNYPNPISASLYCFHFLSVKVSLNSNSRAVINFLPPNDSIPNAG